MQAVVSESREPVGPTYAEPLSGLCISWGAVLAGTVAMLATALLLWALALAIVALATHPSAASFKASFIALWICAIGTTLVGALVGGWVAGALPGNPRKRIGMAHGFVSWGLALILSFVFGVFVLGGTLRTATTAGVTTASAAVEATGAAAGGAVGANSPLSRRARQTLVSLGYTREQARRIVTEAKGKGAAITQGTTGTGVGAGIESGLSAVGRTVIDFVIALGWTWFGTWFVSLWLALAGGAAGATRLTRVAGPGERREVIERERPMGPLTPAPTT
jgi:hypothetical protein